MTITDPAFGTLEYRNAWIGEIEIQFLTKSFELTINNSLEFPPDKEDQHTRRMFLQPEAQWRQAGPRAITHWCLTNLNDLRNVTGR